MRTKPFLAPVWFMLSIAIFAFFYNYLLFSVVYKINTSSMRGFVLFMFLLWPLLILSEGFVYWLIRYKITERKWAWAHVIFILSALVLLRCVEIILLALRIIRKTDSAIARFEAYLFWSSVIIAHIFFVIVLVRSFTAKKNLPPDDSFLDIPH